jgi:hypothetical protein
VIRDRNDVRGTRDRGTRSCDKLGSAAEGRWRNVCKVQRTRFFACGLRMTAKGGVIIGKLPVAAALSTAATGNCRVSTTAANPSCLERSRETSSCADAASGVTMGRACAGARRGLSAALETRRRLPPSRTGQLPVAGVVRVMPGTPGRERDERTDSLGHPPRATP